MDVISDMLNRIKNAQAVGKPTAEIPFSNLKYEIAQLLVKMGFIEGVDKKGKKSKRTFEVTLKYQDKTPAILGIKRISKPGQRIYLPSRRIRKVKGGYGMSMVSTSKGLMTEKEARKQRIGGEILFEIW